MPVSPIDSPMLAVVVVREGTVPQGADEAVAECGGDVLLVGSNTLAAADGLRGVARRAWCLEWGDFAPAAWAHALVGVVAGARSVVLPGSPDGRDLAPRLAYHLERPLHTPAVRIAADHVVVARRGGQQMARVATLGPSVTTLLPGVRGVDRDDSTPTVVALPIEPPRADVDARLLEVLPPDAATIDLAEAPRILGGGAGLDSAERFDQLAELGRVLGASVGATRVITDRGWIAHERQIGTTGVVVDPQLYIAFGVSGAVQHTTGLGDPAHIISVNTDPHCPMMQMADLGVVADGNAVLEALVTALVPEVLRAP